VHALIRMLDTRGLALGRLTFGTPHPVSRGPEYRHRYSDTGITRSALDSMQGAGRRMGRPGGGAAGTDAHVIPLLSITPPSMLTQVRRCHSSICSDCRWFRAAATSADGGEAARAQVNVRPKLVTHTRVPENWDRRHTV
jgi:hypothetical protein